MVINIGMEFILFLNFLIKGRGMKGKIVTLAALCVMCIQGMETNFWSMTVGDTTIRLSKGFIGDAGDRVDILVVGKNQQHTLEEPMENGFDPYVGKIGCYNNHIIYRKSVDHESSSDDDNYKRYKHKSTVWQKRREVCVKSDIVSIVEPCIKKIYVREGLSYFARRENPEKENSYIVCNEEDEDAIEEASKDLKMCYRKIFSSQKLGNKKRNSIALSTLGADVGFPRKEAAEIAVKMIIKSIKNNSHTYDVVELIVKKRSEFVWYKDFLEKYAAEK